jgi:hypothetical protein
MRQIHPTSLHEKFVASGVYSYTHNGKPAEFIERWSVHELPDGSQIVRVDRDAMGLTLLLEALRDSHSIARFDAHLFTSVDGVFRQVRATYLFNNGFAQIGRTLNNGTHSQTETPLTPNTAIYPNARIFLGSVVRQLANQPQNETSVFSFHLADPSDPDTLLGVVENRPVHLVGVKEVDFEGVATKVQGYHFLGGSYDEKTIFWIDEYDLLIQYEYQHEDDQWLAVLTNYAHRPSP